MLNKMENEIVIALNICEKDIMKFPINNVRINRAIKSLLQANIISSNQLNDGIEVRLTEYYKSGKWDIDEHNKYMKNLLKIP